MSPAFLIVFREALEASLIIRIIDELFKKLLEYNGNPNLLEVLAWLIYLIIIRFTWLQVATKKILKYIIKFSMHRFVNNLIMG